MRKARVIKEIERLEIERKLINEKALDDQ